MNTRTIIKRKLKLYGLRKEFFVNNLSHDWNNWRVQQKKGITIFDNLKRSKVNKELLLHNKTTRLNFNSFQLLKLQPWKFVFLVNNSGHGWNSYWKWEAHYWLRHLVQLLPHFLPLSLPSSILFPWPSKTVHLGTPEIWDIWARSSKGVSLLEVEKQFRRTSLPRFTRHMLSLTMFL